jgi:hypothetical protein
MQSTLYLYSNTTGTPTVVDTKGKLAECDNFRIRELSKGYNTFVLADPTSTDLDLSVVHRKVCVFAADLDGIEAWTYISSTQNPAYSMYPPDLIIDRERYTSAKNAIDFMKLGATLSGSSLSSAEAANALGTTSSEDMVTPVELDDIKPIKKTTLSTFLLGELSQFKNKEGPTSKLLSVVNEHFAINFGINEFVFTVNQLDGFSANAGTIKVWIK